MAEPHSAFWASVEHFRALCPRCQALILVVPPNRRYGDAHLSYYDRTAQTLTCPQCKARYQVGLLFYPVGTRYERPSDVRPSKRTLAELRRLAGGWWMRRKHIGDAPVNLVIPEPCTCAPDPWRASCPVHGGERIGDDSV